MPKSAFIDVKYPLICPKCGHQSIKSIRVCSDGLISFGTYCGGVPPNRRKKDTLGCGKFIVVKGTWEYKITSIIYTKG